MGFLTKINSFAERNSHITLVLVPSLRDIFHDLVFPQPAFYGFDISEKIMLVGNPSTFFINELVFSVSTNDILFHLGGEEISK